MATFPVKHVSSTMRGAPQLSGTAGTLIAALDAFLVTGFGQVTALAVNVSGGIATATLNAGQSFDPRTIVQVQGATPAALNGEARVLTSSSTGITWVTTAPDGAATGTITIKVAPAGWEKLFTGTNKAVYRSTDPQASGFCLRVDDTGTTAARVRGFETMSDVDTGTGPFPTDAQINGGGYWIKSSAANAVVAPYVLIADSRAVLVAIAAGVPSSGQYLASPMRGFGDMLPLAPGGDVWSCALSCSQGGSAGGAQDSSGGAFDAPESGASAIYVSRDISGIGGARASGARPFVGSGVSGQDATLGVFPSVVDGQLKYSQRFLYQNSGAGNAPPRARIPGLLHVPQSGVLGLVNRLDTLDGSGELQGRTLLALATLGGWYTQAPTGISLVDITGPWR